jgi:hypothetical protein
MQTFLSDGRYTFFVLPQSQTQMQRFESRPDRRDVPYLSLLSRRSAAVKSTIFRASSGLLTLS